MYYEYTSTKKHLLKVGGVWVGEGQGEWGG